jgi:uncharacterized protein (DUF1800 family)
MPPALTTAPVAAERRKPKKRNKGKRKFHRCEVHTAHTCWYATTCKHRNHHATTPSGPKNPGNPGTPGTPGNPSKPGTPSTPVPIPMGDLPSAEALHLGSRFSYGVTPALYADMRAAGSHQAWFEQQLAPAGIDDGAADQLESWWTSLNLDAATIWSREKANVESSWTAMANYQRWLLMRRIVSKRQLLEVMTEFWESHLHVPVHDDGVFGFRADYGKLIRANALGKFDEMLAATTIHPAMGTSLDNATSTKKAPNENLGRELLELHTVGRGNYTEDDVKNSARILTGYRVDMWNTWRSWYDAPSHWTGAVTVMGFSSPNAGTDGQQVARDYLLYLARHPATAARIARKLAVRFVSDSPSDALVAQLAQVYLANGTAIVPVLRALVASPEFAAAAGAKVRTPSEDVVATWRALGASIAKPVNDNSTANAILWQTTAIGAAPHDWPRPDGPPDRGSAWSSASRVLASFQEHYNMAGTWWPKQDATYQPLASWVPITGTQSVRFDALVDSISQRMLCRTASQRVQEAAAAATGLTAGTAITLNHSLVKWGMPALLTTLLDSPEHLTR